MPQTCSLNKAIMQHLRLIVFLSAILCVRLTYLVCFFFHKVMEKVSATFTFTGNKMIKIEGKFFRWKHLE